MDTLHPIKDRLYDAPKMMSTSKNSAIYTIRNPRGLEIRVVTYSIADFIRQIEMDDFANRLFQLR